jgi:hypothetical protein
MALLKQSILVAIMAAGLGAGCGKGGAPAAEAPEGSAASEDAVVVGVGDAQQAANLATRLNEEAAQGKTRTVEVHARYALALSCPCAPITLANAPPTPTQGSYLLPVVAGGESNPADYEVVGEFRLYGHYSGEPIPLGEWLDDTGKPPHKEATEAHLKAPYLAFVVDRWCYVPPAEGVEMLAERASEDEFSARMTKLVEQLRDEGRFCE